MKTRTTFAAVILLILFALLSSSLLQGQIAPQNPNLTIFFSGDQNGEVASCGCPKEDYGGVTHRAAFLDTLRTAGWELLTVDGGDLSPFEELNLQGKLKVEALTRSMATMDYDAITLGEHDLKPGADWVGQIVDWLEQPVLATNYDLSDGRSERARMVDVRGKKVGLLAFLDPELTETMDWLKVEPWEDQGAHVESVSKNANVVVALVHTANEIQVNRLIELFPAIDLVLPAHEGRYPGPIEKIGNSFIVGSAGRGRYLARVEVTFGPDKKPSKMESAYLPVVEGWGRRAWTDTLLTHYYADMRILVKSAAFKTEALGALEEPDVEFVGNETCMSCHASQGVQWETTDHAGARMTLVAAEQDHDPECQQCHTTGFGFRTGFATAEATPEMWNVGCENCHGGGAVHVDDPEQPYGAVSQDLCIACHDKDNSPDFDYRTFLPRVVHTPE
jgi:hypothetical protein